MNSANIFIVLWIASMILLFILVIFACITDVKFIYQVKETRQDKFLEMFPNVYINPSIGCINICPYEIDSLFKCLRHPPYCMDIDCIECKKKFWLEKEE